MCLDPDWNAEKQAAADAYAAQVRVHQAAGRARGIEPGWERGADACGMQHWICRLCGEGMLAGGPGPDVPIDDLGDCDWCKP